MPTLTSGLYLINLLHEAGTISYNDGIAKRLSWTELKAWADLSGYVLDSWEADTIMQLSLVYADMLNEATDPLCPMPMVRVMTQDKRAQVANSVKNALRSIAKVR